MPTNSSDAVTYSLLASRGVGRWHKRLVRGTIRYYRWLRWIGYVRVPRVVTPWRIDTGIETGGDPNVRA